MKTGKYLAILILCFNTFIFANALIIDGNGHIEALVKYEIFQDYESPGYSQKVIKEGDKYKIRVSVSIGPCLIHSALYDHSLSEVNEYDEKIICILREITANSVYLHQVVQSIVYWARSMVVYNKELRTSGADDFYTIIERGEGTCVDIVYIISKLMDVAGIENNIMRGILIDDSGYSLHRWLEFNNGKGEFVQLDPLSSVFFIMPNYLFIKKGSRYDKSYYDFDIGQYLQNIEIIRAVYNFVPLDRSNDDSPDILIAGTPPKQSGIVVFDRKRLYDKVVIKGNSSVYMLTRDRVLTFSLFDLPDGRYEVYSLNDDRLSLIKNIFIRNKELYFAGR